MRMNKSCGFVFLILISASISFAGTSKPTFESIFGEYAKAYYEYNFVGRSQKSVDKMEKAVKSTGRISREERAKVLLLLMIKFEPDGEGGHIFREVIRENGDVDYLLSYTKGLLGSSSAWKTQSEEKNLGIVISFLNSMKKAK